MPPSPHGLALGKPIFVVVFVVLKYFLTYVCKSVSKNINIKTFFPDVTFIEIKIYFIFINRYILYNMYKSLACLLFHKHYVLSGKFCFKLNYSFHINTY